MSLYYANVNSTPGRSVMLHTGMFIAFRHTAKIGKNDALAPAFDTRGQPQDYSR